MATRPVFIATREEPIHVQSLDVDFHWLPGQSTSRKKERVRSLHDAAKRQGLVPLLEISTKSDDALGRSLSAFNLEFQSSTHGTLTVESAFQGSKIFASGGPHTEVYRLSPVAGRRFLESVDTRQLVGFEFEGATWPLRPRSAFYDWLYVRALLQNLSKATNLAHFKGFTDIEFNPGKSLNCQARAAALFVALDALQLLPELVDSPEEFRLYHGRIVVDSDSALPSDQLALGLGG